MPTTINHTTVYYGTESNPGDLGKDVAPKDTNYSDFIKDFDKGTYNIPLQFVGNTDITKTGTYYYRAQATINGENYWTDEKTLEVLPAVKITAADETPTEAPSPTEEPTVTP